MISLLFVATCVYSCDFQSRLRNYFFFYFVTLQAAQHQICDTISQPVNVNVLHVHLKQLVFTKKCFRKIYAPHGAKFRFIFSIEAKLAAITQPSPIFKILIFLGDGYDSIGSLQWRSSGSDSLPLCLGHFPTSYMKNNCMKNSLNV